MAGLLPRPALRRRRNGDYYRPPTRWCSGLGASHWMATWRTRGRNGRATTGPAASRTGAAQRRGLSVISGVLLMRRVVGARALDERNADHLVELLEAVFGAVVDTR